jgi:hypothetical protein
MVMLLPFPIFVLRSKQKDMLQSISWSQFISFIFFGLLMYYGYILIRYYGLEIRHWISDRRGQSFDVAAQSEEGLITKEPAAEVAKEVAVKEGEDLDLFKVTDTAIGKVTAMLNAAKASPISRGEIEERLRSVLTGFGELRNTQHQETINQIIERACVHHFNIRIEMEALRKLWR